MAIFCHELMITSCPAPLHLNSRICTLLPFSLMSSLPSSMSIPLCHLFLPPFHPFSNLSSSLSLFLPPFLSHLLPLFLSYLPPFLSVSILSIPLSPTSSKGLVTSPLMPEVTPEIILSLPSRIPSRIPPLFALFLCLFNALLLAYSASPLRKLIPFEAVPTRATVEFIAPLE